MTCPRCDSPTDGGARFCATCGAPLDAATTAQPTVADAPADDESLWPDGADEGSLWPDDEVDATPDVGPDPTTAGARRADAPAPPSRATASTVACPACGATNSTARMLCGRCGVDLDTGEEPVADVEVVHPGPAVDVVGEVDVSDDGDGPRTALVIAAIVVVGALVGVGIGIWAVGAGEPDTAARPTFDAGVYPGEPEELRVSAVGASSEREAAGETTYGAANMVDGDVTTAWSHDPSSEAATDVDLAFSLEEPAWVTSVVLANGAQADESAFAADGRVRTMLLVVDNEPVAELRLRDIDGFQRVELPSPVLVDTIAFVITEVYPGDTFAEVSLSEVSFLGHPATGDDVTRVSGAG